MKYLTKAVAKKFQHLISLSSYDGYKLNLLLACFQQGFIAQLVEDCTGITEGPEFKSR